MRPSKKKVVRLIENAAEKYLGNYFYSLVLFMRYYNNFAAVYYQLMSLNLKILIHLKM